MTKVTKVTEPPERSLPHNLDAERSVLGAILLNNAVYIDAHARLKSEDFYRDAHRRIYEAMMRLLERADGACDFTLLMEELKRTGELETVGGAQYIAGLVDGVPRSTNIRYYAGIVHEKAQARRVIYTANRVIAEAYELDRPVREILAEADSRFLELRQNMRDGQVLDLSQSTSSLMSDLEYRVANRGKLTGLDTGFKSINDMTFGWQPGDYIIFAARPSMGKTALLLNTLRAAAEFPRADGTQRSALAFSMEMTAQQLQYRLLSSMSGIPATRLAGGFLGPDGSSDWLALNTALERMHGMRVFIDDRAARTVADIRAEARRIDAEHGLDIIVIDYVQLMASVLEKRGASRTEELADTSRKLKSLAKELRVPIILVSQLRRISGRPKLEDLRECGSLEQDADIVAFLHRKNHKEGGTTEFIFEKNRNGPTGTELLTFHKEVVNFTDGGVEPTPEERAAEDAEEQKAERTKRRKGHYARRASGVD